MLTNSIRHESYLTQKPFAAWLIHLEVLWELWGSPGPHPPTFVLVLGTAKSDKGTIEKQQAT